MNSFKGFTTGTTATAATLAAVQMLVKQQEILQVKLITPAEHELVIPVHNVQFTPRYATCSVFKEVDNDSDVTNGIEIYASVTWRQDQEIVIFGGEGVGVVVKEGLPMPIGEAAISPVPRRMMMTAARSQIGYQRGVNITLSVPKGRLIANVTSNVEAGVEGGISILGTSGIITQCSETDLKQHISNEIARYANNNYRNIIFIADEVQSEQLKKYVQNEQTAVIYMSYHLEHALSIAHKHQFKNVTIISNLSQLMKISVGMFHIHSRNGHPQNEILLAHLALQGASREFIERVDRTKSLAKKIKIIQQSPLHVIFDQLAQRAKEELQQFVEVHNYQLDVDIVVVEEVAAQDATTTKKYMIEYSRTV